MLLSQPGPAEISRGQNRPLRELEDRLRRDDVGRRDAKIEAAAAPAALEASSTDPQSIKHGP